MSFETDHLDGQMDCKEGREAQEGRADAYYDGYGAQYELEQVMTEMNRNEFR